MKVCLINNLFQPFARGGSETVVENIAKGLGKNGHKAVIITTRPFFGKKEPSIGNSFRFYYIPGFYYNLYRIPKFIRLFWHLIDMFDIGSFLSVRKILRKEKPDIIMTHNLKGIGYLIPLAVRQAGIKHIHTLHDIQLIHPSGLMIRGEEKKIDGLFAKMYAAICRLLFGSPDLVISPSKWLLNLYEKRGFFKESKKIILPSPMNPPHTPLLKGGAGGLFRFLYVGQIEEHKGILFLIEAFKKINTPFNKGGAGGFLGSELLIAGDGSKIKKTKESAAGIENIKILGRIDNNEVKKMMREADALIMPSLCYENSPTVIYEAFAAGLPVIASNLGGVPELLENGAGILFKAGDKEDLKNKMKWAMENYGELEKISVKALEKIKKYSVEKYIDMITKLL